MYMFLMRLLVFGATGYGSYGQFSIIRDFIKERRAGGAHDFGNYRKVTVLTVTARRE